ATSMIRVEKVAKLYKRRIGGLFLLDGFSHKWCAAMSQTTRPRIAAIIMKLRRVGEKVCPQTHIVGKMSANAPVVKAMAMTLLKDDMIFSGLLANVMPIIIRNKPIIFG